MPNIVCTSINGGSPYKLKVERSVGSGGFGCVYKLAGENKVIKYADDLMNECAMYDVLKKIIPANIPTFYDRGTCTVDNDKYVYIIIEYIPYSLNMEFTKSFSTDAAIKTAMNIYNDMVNILDTIHQHGLVHRDIKPSNILIKEVNGVFIPVLIDFGLINDVIPISGNEIYYAGTRCYSSIYQHMGLYCTPIDDFIELVYTWMQIFKHFGEHRVPWETSFLPQERKKHEFYMLEKYLYLDAFDDTNFWDRTLRYLYSLPHFWTSRIDLQRVYYIDPLQRYTFKIHSISAELPKSWNKMIKQESLLMNTKSTIAESLRDQIGFVRGINLVRTRTRTDNLTISISDCSWPFTYYMFNQYRTMTGTMFDHLKQVVEVFINKRPAYGPSMCDWMKHILTTMNTELSKFNTIMTSIHHYRIIDVFAFFNYARCQTILRTAYNKLPSITNDIAFAELQANLTRIFNRLPIEHAVSNGYMPVGN